MLDGLRIAFTNIKDQICPDLEKYSKKAPKVREALENHLTCQIKQLVRDYGLKEVKAGQDVVFGDKHRYSIIFNIVQNIELEIRTGSSRAAIEKYKASLISQLGKLHFTPEGTSTSELDADRRKRPRLEQIYVVLKAYEVDREKLEKNIEIQPQKNSKSIDLQEAILDHPFAVVLGRPGSGKSTFFRHLLILFIRSKVPPENWPDHALDYAPVFLELRQLVRWYERLDEKHKPEANANVVWKYIEYQLETITLEGAYQWLRECANVGRLFLVMDGLDEVPLKHTDFIKLVIRSFVEAEINSLKDPFECNRVLITCRYLSWAEPKWRLNWELPLYMIEDWDDKKITAFTENWYQTAVMYWGLQEDRKAEMTVDFLHAIQRPRLEEIKRIPLLLTIMAVIHTEKQVLPKRITELYAKAVDKLIARWDTVKPDENHRLEQLLREGGIDRERLKAVLARTAWDAHSANQSVAKSTDTADRLAEIPDWKLVKALCKLREDEDEPYNWAFKVKDGMRLRAGLLLPVGGQEDSFQFPHLSFQEYMAGLHLSCVSDHKEERTKEFPDGFSKTAWALAGQEGNYWHYVIRFAVGSLKLSDSDHSIRLRNLLNKLRGEGTPRNDADWRRLWLAAELLMERGNSAVEKDVLELLGETHTGLKQLISQGALNWRERAEVADLLNSTARRDDRPGVWIPNWAMIESTPLNLDDMTRRLDIPHDFCISRHLVTVAQYTKFIDAKGYEDMDLWTTEAAQQWLKELDGQVPKKKAPNKWETQRIHPNRPVYNVTWHEARAWCAWATTQLALWQKKSYSKAIDTLLRQGECVVRLPTEKEWECAARGAKDRLYPWGNSNWTPEHAMLTDDNNPHLGHPVAVGLFPKGSTPDTGIKDMAGNVWEWTLSSWHENSYSRSRQFRQNGNDTEQINPRVVRGGGYSNPPELFCVSRYYRNPDVAWSLQGFRVVVSLLNSEY